MFGDEIGDEMSDEATVQEATVQEATVQEARVQEARVQEARVQEGRVQEGRVLMSALQPLQGSRSSKHRATRHQWAAARRARP